jgi:dTDP-L-rhamnose 4-epimerase
MRVLVTGGSGFIGSHTVAALLAEGHWVRVLDNLAKRIHPRGRPAYLATGVDLIEGDVRDKAVWERALDGIDAIYHLTAYQDYLPDFSTFFHVNCVGTALLYEVAVERRLPLQKVVVASSQAVYGEGRYICSSTRCATGGGPTAYYPDIRPLDELDRGKWDHHCPACGEILTPQPTDESRVNPQNQYALSKHAQESIALSLGKRYGIPTVAMRYSIVQGPRQSFHNAYSGACRIFCLSYYLNRQPTVYEDGRQLRDYVNIEDVVRANLLVLKRREADYQVFNVGGGRPYTVIEFERIVQNVFGTDLPPKLRGEYRFGDMRHIVSDIGKLKALGWEPCNGPEKSVRDYLAWLKDQVGIEGVLEYAEATMKKMNVVRRAELEGTAG